MRSIALLTALLLSSSTFASSKLKFIVSPVAYPEAVKTFSKLSTKKVKYKVSQNHYLDTKDLTLFHNDITVLVKVDNDTDAKLVVSNEKVYRDDPFALKSSKAKKGKTPKAEAEEYECGFVDIDDAKTVLKDPSRILNEEVLETCFNLADKGPHPVEYLKGLLKNELKYKSETKTVLTKDLKVMAKNLNYRHKVYPKILGESVTLELHKTHIKNFMRYGGKLKLKKVDKKRRKAVISEFEKMIHEIQGSELQKSRAGKAKTSFTVFHGTRFHGNEKALKSFIKSGQLFKKKKK
jgi:hypothetical protein